MGFSVENIAPCGVNCGACIAYLREKNKCYGCLSPNNIKTSRTIKCGLKFCNEHKATKFTYCFECQGFPCARLKRMDKRYVEKYNLSVINNLIMIKENGFEDFIEKENEKWKCSNCGEILSVHQSFCLNCKKEYR
jgi:hypothetical protein